MATDEALSDAEFDELDAFLNRTGEDRGMTVEGLDGFFAALVCSPVLAKPSEWMPVVWGGDMPEWESLKQAQHAMGLLMRLWNQVASSINDGSFSPLTTTGVNPAGENVTLPHAWCAGFNQAMRMHGRYWFDDSRSDLQELLLPIVMVNADAMLRLGDIKQEGMEPLTAEDLNRIADLIPAVVVELRGYWLAHPVERRPVPPRQGPKVGRNAPCPCGSGKKFKHCHGGPETEH